MKFRTLLNACAGAALAAAALPATAYAQSHPEFVRLGRASGAVYKPDAGGAHVAVLVSHRTGNVIGSGTCPELAKRGFVSISFNTRFANNEASVHWEDEALDVKSAVEYARTIPGVTKILLLGHSGGSPEFSYYEAVAEAGMTYCQGPGKLVQCTNKALGGMKPADGMIFPDAHPGSSVEVLRALDPSVMMKPDGSWTIDPKLDPFSEANGFNPKGNSHYSEDFRKRYYTGQSDRMNRMIADAQAKMALIKEGMYRYSDDDIVVIPGGGNPNPGAGADAALHSYDPSIPESMQTTRPEKLLKNDGTIVTQIVYSVAVGTPALAKGNRAFATGTKIFTLQSFLSAAAIKSTNSEDGIDWCSTNNSTVCAVRSIKVPTLIEAMGAYKFIRDQEILFDESAAKDKDYIVIEGAVHGYTPCKPCENMPGQYANSEKNMYDYMEKWIRARF